jgi:Ca2+-transporting ATPase
MNIRLTESPMMTHVFQTRKRIIAAKGGPKTIMGSDLNAEQKAKDLETIEPLASKDARILGVCYTEFKGTNTQKSEDFLSFLWDWWFSMTRQSQYSTCNPAVL